MDFRHRSRVDTFVLFQGESEVRGSAKAFIIAFSLVVLFDRFLLLDGRRGRGGGVLWGRGVCLV